MDRPDEGRQRDQETASAETRPRGQETVPKTVYHPLGCPNGVFPAHTGEMQNYELVLIKKYNFIKMIFSNEIYSLIFENYEFDDFKEFRQISLISRTFWSMKKKKLRICVNLYLGHDRFLRKS